MRRALTGLAAMAMLLGVLSTTTDAGAVVPGANGRILFARALLPCNTGCAWELVAADPNDTNETVLAGPFPRSSWDDHFVANWSPDGGTVIFIADLGEGQGIWQADADGTDLREIFAAPAGTFLDDGPSFTPDGTRIIFTRVVPEGEGYTLWSIDADGTDLRNVTKEPFVNGDGPSHNLPQVSPDGKKIVFGRCVPDASPHGCTDQVATVTINGKNLRLLTDPSLNAQVANWSPDGKTIVFEMFPVVNGQEAANIATINADGSGFTQLTFDAPGKGGNLDPSWSPDGTKIIFRHCPSTGFCDLFTMDPDGSHITQITRTGTGEFWPQWAATVS